MPKPDLRSEILRGPGDSPDCVSCPFARDGRPHKPVLGEGPEDPKFIIIGEGPGRHEIQKGRPFVGKSGRLLMDVLKQVGVEREDVWLTNGHLCDPGAKRGLSKGIEACRPRLIEELSDMPGLPILTLGAGASHTILKSSDQVETFKITDWAGALFDEDVDGTGVRPIIPAIHPAAILRGGAGSAKGDRAAELAIWDFTYDVGKLAALASGKKVRFVEDFEIEYEDPARSLELMREMYEAAKESGLVAIDIETKPDDADTHSSALDTRTAVITSIGVACAEWALALSWEMYEAEDGAVFEVFKTLCADPDVAITYHNRQFDMAVLRRYGVSFRGEMHDTLLKHHAVFPGAGHKLQRVVTQFFARSPWKSDYRHGEGDMAEELEYCSKDAHGTVRVDPLLGNAMLRTDSHRCYQVDNTLADVAMRMTWVGVPINRERNAELATQFISVMDRTRAEIKGVVDDPEIRARWIDRLAYQKAQTRRKADPPDFMARHAQRVQELTHGVRGKKGFILKGKEPITFKISTPDHQIALIQALGYTLTKKTATGKYAGDKDVLEQFAHVPEVRTIMEYKEAAYQYSHFVRLAENHPEGKGLILDEDDCVHIDWDIHKITGRWGSSPNFQNHPKGKQRQDEHGNLVVLRPNLRSQVIAPEGRTFVGADFDKLEARIIAMMSGDPTLVNVLMADRSGCQQCEKAAKFCPEHDIHTMFAVAVWPNFLEMRKEERKELRDLVKRGEYGGFYGGAIDTLFASIVKEFPEVTKGQVAKIVEIINSKMARVGVWHNNLMRSAIKEREIRSAILGRRRCFPMGNADPSVVYNFPVQSAAADIMNLGLIELCRQLTQAGYYDVESTEICQAEPILQVHDSVIVECDEEIAPHVQEIMNEALTQERTFNGTRMLYPAEADISIHWSEVG